MLTNKHLITCFVILLAGVSMMGCNRSPQAKEAQFLKRGKESLVKRDLARALLEFKNAAQVMPKDPEPYYQSGLAYNAFRDFRDAAIAFKKATILDPKHTGAQLKLAELEVVSRNQELLDDALARLQLIVDSSPDNLEAINALAIAQFRSGETEGATTLLEETLDKFPKNLRSAISLERIKMGQGDSSGAEAVLQKAATDSPQSPFPVLALAQLYVIRNEPEKAEKAFHRALELDPKAGPALLGIAALQLASNHLDLADQSLQRLASFPDPKYLPVHALFLYQTGRKDAALAEFEKIAKDHPDDESSRARLLQAYLETKQWPKAEGLVASVLKKNPKDVTALFQRSKLYFRAGKLQEAQEDLTQVLRLTPNAIPAHRALAGVYGAQGRLLLERQELGEALRLNPAILQSRLELANSFLSANQPDSALRQLNDAPEPQKKTLLWNLERNRGLLSLRKNQELRTALNEQLSQIRLPEFVLQDALLKLSEHDYAGAIASGEEVLRANAGDATAARVIAAAFLGQKQPAKAVERLRQLVAAQPASASLQALLGEWELRVGNAESSRIAWTAAKAADPRLLQADVALSELDRWDNHPEVGHRRLLAAVQGAPSDVPTLAALAQFDENTGDIAEAMATYGTILAIDGDNLLALNNLAWHLAIQNPEEGLKLAQKAASLAPRNAMVEDTLGWALYRKGSYNTATAHLKEAFSREPTPQREFHLAMSYLKSGDKNLGQKTLEAALRKDPNLFKTEKGW